MDFSEEELRRLLTSRPRPAARQSAFNTGALIELRTIATDEEIQAVKQLVNEIEKTPLPQEGYKLSLLARVIERARSIRLGHAPQKP